MKAVLVIDAPLNCASCQLWSICTALAKHEFETYEDVLYSEVVGKGTNSRMAECPLRPLPEKMEKHTQILGKDGSYSQGFVDGYNAYRAKILGETE